MSLRSHVLARPRSDHGRRATGGRSRRALVLQAFDLEGRTLLSASPSGGANGPLLASEARFVPDEILVQFKAGTTDAAKAEARGSAVLEERIQTGPMRAAGYEAIERLSVPHGLSVAAAVQALKGHSSVQFAEPNYVFSLQDTPNAPYYPGGSLWGMEGDNTSPANAYGSQAGEAWARGDTGSPSVYVSIIDEGVQFDHPDLA